ncbi:hypothetical protein FM107_05255 [Sphingobacterium sp. JB170]|nr:hypothetical protein FM107_05255 [Sphingobacterium sp. JB170]
MTYLSTVIIVLFVPQLTAYAILKLLIISSLLLLLFYFYKSLGFFNINYRIPDMICIFCLVSQFGDIVWHFISWS